MAKLYNLARVSTATTGTGTITLGSAVAGFLSFAGAGVADGETVTYAIKDGSNAEIGRGVYTTSGTTLTRTVLKSTNSNNAISLSGSAVVFITAAAEDFNKLNNTLGAYTVALAAGTNVTADRTLTLTTGDANRTLDISAGNATISAYGATLIDDATAVAAQATLGIREVLTAARTYYVRTDGSDSNTGLANTSGGAFLTIQKAINVASALDTSTYDVTIQLGNGTYTTSTGNVLKNTTGAGTITIIGDTTTPSNVVVATNGAMTGNNAIFYGDALFTKYIIRGVQMSSSGSGVINGITAANGSYVEYNNVTFASGIATSHVRAFDGGIIRCSGAYTITGSGASHMTSVGNGVVRCQGFTITLTGTPAFSTAFADTTTGGVVFLNGNTYSGAATGARYSATTNSVVFVSGGGASYLPGDVAGSTSSGGQYV